jgi:phage baseplate assembly protein W
MEISERTTRIWKDIDMNFARHPVTDDISILLDAESVKRSLKNLLMTISGERPFQPWIGSSINELLFDPIDNLSVSSLRSEIKLLIENFEPRVSINNIDIKGTDSNEFKIKLEFTLVNFPTERVFTLDTLLQRIK